MQQVAKLCGFRSLHRPRLSRGLVGCWLTDDSDPANAPDHSGLLNVGTIMGASWVAGKLGRALSFDGTDDFVNCGAGSSLNFGAGDFSIAVWFKTSLAGWFVNKGDEVLTPYFRLYNRTSDPFVRFGISDHTTTIQTTSESVDPRDGAYHFAVGVRSGNSVLLFIDGVLKQSVSGATGISITNTGNLRIGSQYANSIGTNYYSGILDDVRIWNRALSTSEVKDLYKSRRIQYGG